MRRAPLCFLLLPTIISFPSYQRMGSPALRGRARPRAALVVTSCIDYTVTTVPAGCGWVASRRITRRKKERPPLFCVVALFVSVGGGRGEKSKSRQQSTPGDWCDIFSVKTLNLKNPEPAKPCRLRPDTRTPDFKRIKFANVCFQKKRITSHLIETAARLPSGINLDMSRLSSERQGP